MSLFYQTSPLSLQNFEPHPRVRVRATVCVSRRINRMIETLKLTNRTMDILLQAPVTVKKHTSHIYQKLRVNNRGAASAAARGSGLVQPVPPKLLLFGYYPARGCCLILWSRRRAMTTDTSTPIYRITVQGRVDQTWSESLAGLDITEDETSYAYPVSVLTGPLADQSTLHGVLDLLFMLNLTLVHVERGQEVD